MLKNSSIKFQKKILSDFLIPNTKIPVKNTKDYQKITIKLNFKGIETFESDREYADTRPFYIRNKGELIVGKQNFFNGSIAYIPDHLDGSICSNAIMSFEVKNIDKSYLLAFLSRPSYLNKHKKKANGTGQKELSENDFLNLDILVPDNLNQKKIGAFLSAIDRLIEKQKEKIENVKRLKRYFINASKQKNKKLKMYKVEDLFKITRGDVLPMGLVNDIKTSNYLYPVYSSQTQKEGLAGYFTEFLFENAITWTTDGANAGDVKYRKGKFYCTNVCGVLINKEGYANTFVAEAINSIAKKYVSYVGNPKLMNSVMGKIPIFLPSLEEQLKLSFIFETTEELIHLLQEKLNRLGDYKKAYLQKLFAD